MHKGYFNKKVNTDADENYDLDKSPLDRRKGSRRAVLTTKEKLDIAHAVIIEHREVKEIAKEYRVTCALVRHYVSKIKKTPGFIREILGRAEQK